MAEFSITKYLDFITEEFMAVGMNVSIKKKEKSTKSNIDSAFLKSETLWSKLTLENSISTIGFFNKPNIKIKIEVDINPPIGFETEDKLLLKPFSFYSKSRGTKYLVSKIFF